MGWKYALKADIKYALKTREQTTKNSYSYEHLNISAENSLNELESRNQTTDRSISYSSDCDIAILGCGPTGMAIALYLKMWRPELKICIYEKRLNNDETSLAPYERHWLTHLDQNLVSQIIESRDLQLMKTLALEGRVGIDIRNLEYMFLRSIKRNKIIISNAVNYKFNSEFLIDATGGRFLNQSQGEEKFIGNLNDKSSFTGLDTYGKLLDKIPKNRLRIAMRGNTVYPLLDEKALKFAYLKINYIDPSTQNDFIEYAHSLNDFGIYFYSGQMKGSYNRALIFVTLSGNDYSTLKTTIKRPIYILQLIKSLTDDCNISNRFQMLLRFIATHDGSKGAIAEPPFEWSPYFVPRSEIQVNQVNYINIGDSFFNGNPMVGNGLEYHLKEINLVLMILR